ncbi:hypothetical protein FPT84_19680 [Salmonella enterica]|uniref:Uncharacterized protein n=2 Tax=Salmonella enterica I TaxID=59201 RepID=A0A5U3G529_SALET|nr:hypothetical protein [Salmonella enterica]EBH9883292.1 hypothetical protein [Salmonella enterica subsp. enterica serovar Kisarawe]EBP4060912.1 hypothetical protein [Salmonella enterica subsp. enterica]AXD45397.1 hypothetical protein CHD70_25780 [Salmonella enterica]EAA7570662.1 hypothetical protein [Salmonella enterica]EAS5877855.1 hypothetical protein [Salmonella enterica]
MSLEANLELNNQLLTQQNELQARKIALLERLVSTLASGVAMRPDTVAKVQEYHEARPAHEPEPKPEPEPQPETKAALTLDDLEFSDVIALACFYPEQVELSETMLQRAIDYRDAEGEKRVVQIDALDSALLGVKRAKALHKDVLLQLARDIISYWDDLTTLAGRRAFAETWLDAKPGERGTVKPKKASKQPRKGPFFVRHEDGKIGELSTEDELKAHIEAGYTEINKVEYLQCKEEAEKAEPDTGETDFAELRNQAQDLLMRLAKSGYRAEAVAALDSFGAQKLRFVEDKDLPALVARLDKALEAEDD